MELVAGAVLSSFLQVLFDRMASREVVDFLKGRKLSSELLRNLKTTLNTVNGLLADAEEQQITKPAVKFWLSELKTAVYEADDLLDEIGYESLKSKFDTRKEKVFNFFSSRNPFEKKVETKLEEILRILEHLVKQKDALGLKELGTGQNPSSPKKTTYLVDQSDFYVRKKDKEAINQFLQSDESKGGVGVIAIVGEGGMGKTTLAQVLYNDKEVEKQFKLQAWVSVSEKINVLKVSQDILEEVTGEKPDVTTLNQIQCHLKEKLEGSKFLLVLDDIYDDVRDKQDDVLDKWNLLQRPLMYGAQGSKIIVTTRSENFASVMCTHHLKELDDKDCLSLFAKHAFVDRDFFTRPDLEFIRRAIVKRCGGLPLAAKALGILLRSERNDDMGWDKILNSNLWELKDDIVPALRLSYHYLPSNLKRCFSFCAIFPKDYSFNKKELVSLWIAEGFIAQSKGNKMEDVGEKYFQDLVSKSFFHQHPHNNSYFIMHDLVHDLAEHVSKEHCFRLEGNDICKIPEKTCHLSHVRTALDEELRRTFELKGTFKSLHLLTFMSWKQYWMSSYINSEVIEELLSSVEHLRVLSLPGHHNIVKLPDSVGNLKHLRHLNLSGATMEKLPESVSSLYNLQALILCGCQNLVELPTNTGRLINLCCLDTRETNLQKMPPRMGNLTELRVLTHFVLGKKSRSGFKELGKLKHIQGQLSIQNLQNVVNAEDATEASMMNRQHLEILEFKWAGEIKNSENTRNVLDKLQPHTNLECLCIIGYGGTHFPSWMGSLSFSKIVSLKLNGCKNCIQLPALGQLESLKYLSIIEFDKLRSVDAEFYGSCLSKPFQSLEVLVFERMLQWHEWKDEAEAFPLLRELCVRDCPSLTKALPSHLPSLRILEIKECRKLVTTFPRASDVIEMTLSDDSRHVKLAKLSSGLGSLKVFRFHYVESLLEILEQSYGLSSSLEVITIEDYSLLKCFPLESFHKLQKLMIKDCPNLESLYAPGRIPNDQSGNSNPLNLHLRFINCPQLPVGASLPWFPIVHDLEYFDISRFVELVRLPSGFHRLAIHGFKSIEEIKMEQLRGAFTTLEEIYVSDNNLIKCFPLELFPNLKRFRITGCPNLKSFSAPEASPGDLISLCSLEISKQCDTISIPNDGIPAPYSTPPCPYIDAMELRDASRDVMLQRLPSGLHHLLVTKFYSLGIGGVEIEQIFGMFAATSEEIEVQMCDSLECFPLEFFPGLKKLSINACQIFESLTAAEANHGEFISLESLKIFSCPKLISFPRGGLYAPNLTILVLVCCSNLKLLPESMHFHLPSLLQFGVTECPELELFPREGLPSKLEVLSIRSCNKLKFIAGGIQLENMEPSLEETMLPFTLAKLTLMDLENLISLESERLKHLTCLRELDIRDCPKLQSVTGFLQSLFPSLTHLRIERCKQQESFLEGGLPSKLESLIISGCNKLITDLLEQDLQMLSSLARFSIDDCQHVESFPKEMLLPSTLTSLKICNLENLKSLDYKGLQHLTSLAELDIRSCPNLQSIPKEVFPSLTFLSIGGCPVLEQRYEPEKGEDWSKISLIPNIHLAFDGGKQHFARNRS